ncbi:hypothetical protein DYB30_013635, partial [Aphanomyces astaci]
ETAGVPSVSAFVPEFIDKGNDHQLHVGTGKLFADALAAEPGLQGCVTTTTFYGYQHWLEAINMKEPMVSFQRRVWLALAAALDPVYPGKDVWSNHVMNLGRTILETNRHQVLAHVVMEILDASSSDIAIASLTLPPTLRFVLQLLILHEQRVWPNETPTPDLVVGLCGILVLLWRVTARVDALLAHVDTTNGVEEALPLDEINANLKLRLALLTEEWAHAIGVGNGGTPLTNSNHAAFMTKLLQELLRPMGNFLLSVDDDNARRYVLTQLLDKTIDTTIELVDLGDACIYDAIAHEGVILLGVLTSCREVVASVARVTEADRRQLQANIDHLKAWIDATCDRLSTLPSVKRLDRLNQEWNILGIDNRRRRSSFDIIMDTLTSDTMARFYRGKQHQQHSVASMSRISSKMVRTPTGKK